AVLVAAMIILAAYSVFSYRMCTEALSRKEQVGNTIGSRGKVVHPLSPEGMVNIHGELWKARSMDGNIAKGEEVEVVSQEGLKLFVRRAKH
ncbi:MAG: NfeD family protein, partial [Dehalococcoidales bacterium]|nr:NfeD family protein [Dehalococcoidales bacterium]